MVAVCESVGMGSKVHTLPTPTITISKSDISEPDIVNGAVVQV